MQIIKSAGVRKKYLKIKLNFWSLDPMLQYYKIHRQMKLP